MKKRKRIGLLNIEHLKNRLPWSMGVAGVLRLLTWETQNTLGISKTKFQKRIIRDTCELIKNGQRNVEEIDRIISTNIKNEVFSSNAKDIYEEPRKGSLISPIEAQRRLRYFSEEFLNKEFDIFLSLLPDRILTDYFSTHFSFGNQCKWTIIGSSNDFEQSSGISFMSMDTLAYCHQTSTLIAVELKMDSPIGNDQLLKYVFMSAYLESKGIISPNTKLEILVLSPDPETEAQIPSLILNATSQLNKKLFPKKRVSYDEMEALVPRAEQIIRSMNVKHSTWQKFGEYFQSLLTEIPNQGYSESLFKLIEGFLQTLHSKYSRKQKKQVYLP